MKNLDELRREDAVLSFVNIDAAAREGFRDGFVGAAARAISPFNDQFQAYMDAFLKGREHREQVEEVSTALKLDMNDLMLRAFNYFYEAFKRGEVSGA